MIVSGAKMNRPDAQDSAAAAAAAAADASHSFASGAAAADAAPPLPDADADAAFKPQGVAIHLTPMNMVRRHHVQVRLGNGPDCPIVRPPATIWFSLDGRLQAVATPMTSSEADSFEWKDKEDKDSDESIDVDDDGEIDDVDQISVDSGSNKDDDDDDVVFLGEVIKNCTNA